MKAPGRRSIFLFLPALLLVGALGQRFWRSAAPDREAELHATAQGRALLVKELRKEIERDADTHARVYVRKRLLSPGVPEDAIRSLKLTHTKPDHYQVRATVVLPTSEGSTVTLGEATRATAVARSWSKWSVTALATILG